VGRLLYYVCMRKGSLNLLVFFVFTLLPSDFVCASESIPSFDARIVVHTNATIEVTEQIVYDFGENERHGIFRVIPYSYQAGDETYTAEVLSVLVTDKSGVPLPFTESRGNGELTVKIGDPNVMVSGEHIYILTYIVQGPFLYYQKYDELYWNVTGYWQKPIIHASVLVDLPIGAEVLNASCYKGVDGEQGACDKSERLVNIERAGYNAEANSLLPEEGLTVAVAFPKGVIKEVKQSWNRDDMFAMVPEWLLTWYLPGALSFVFFLYILVAWYTKGRDPEGESTVVTQFEPPENMGPSVASVVYSEKVGDGAVAAEILRLAVDGYIKIHRLEKDFLIFSLSDYIFVRTNDTVPTDTVSARVLEKLFQDDFMDEEEVGGSKVQVALLSRMKNEFADEKNSIEAIGYECATENGYFVQDPDKVRTRYIVGTALFQSIAIIWAIVIVFATHTPDGLFFLKLFTPVVVLQIVSFVFAYHMPARTREGVRMLEHLEGFKRYLEVAEKERIAFHDAPEKEDTAPEKTVEIFSRFLPYAVLFGVEDKWVGQFDGILRDEPKWYSGSSGAFSASAFATDMKVFSQNVGVATAPHSSGSSGGGSVGGGFGGGRGGSW